VGYRISWFPALSHAVLLGVNQQTKPNFFAFALVIFVLVELGSNNQMDAWVDWFLVHGN